MPLKYENDANFVSIVFTRDPMSRLVSAWNFQVGKIKSKKILEIFNDGPIPSSQKAAKEEGFRLSFKDFITWISRGN